jgi:hypothetical protein
MTAPAASTRVDAAVCRAHQHGQARKRPDLAAQPKVPRLLGDLATGRIPLTHQGLHAAPSWRTAAYLRDLLMTCGVLPTIDKQLLHYEALLHRRLTDLADSPHLRRLRQFAVWYQLPRLRAKAKRRPLTPSHRQLASDQLTPSPPVPGLAAGARSHPGPGHPGRPGRLARHPQRPPAAVPAGVPALGDARRPPPQA